MENASQALIMAATILLGIIIVSFAVYTVSLFGDYARNAESDREAQQLEAFNAKFYKYSGLKNISPHDIVTVINMAKENNTTNGFTLVQNANDGDGYVQVVIKGLDSSTLTEITGDGNHAEAWDEDDTQKFIQYYTINNSYVSSYTEEQMQRFECTKVNFGEFSKRVNKIEFEKNNNPALP